MQVFNRIRASRGWTVGRNRLAANSNGSAQKVSKRRFAGGDEIEIPKTYKNVFNKRISRDGKRVYYTVYPHDYNEPWPFPPVYDDRGNDLNHDRVWGKREAPPSSITGKPKRQLGHYPWLGRPIVPVMCLSL